MQLIFVGTSWFILILVSGFILAVLNKRFVIPKLHKYLPQNQTNKIAFRYKAVDSKGNPVESIIEALDKADALKKIQTLKDIGLRDISIEASETPTTSPDTDTEKRRVYWEPPKSIGHAIGQILGAALIGWGLIYLAQSATKKPEPKVTPQIKVVDYSRASDRYDAYWACQKAMKAKLIAPSAAKFQNAYDAPYTILGEDQLRFDTYVDAPNIYNAPIRMPFSCAVEKNDGRWEVLSANLSPLTAS